MLAIAEDPSRAYDYTVKGNFVAVITNGTAILGLGNRGALAAKPVMEGKAVLFKRFADIDSIDLEVSTEDPEEFINCVFHDDQHGTAIISAAGLINALDLTGRTIENTKLVCNGAGAAGIACLELLKAIGFKPENLILCDTKGVIYQGRTEGMNQWKSAYAIKTSARTLGQGGFHQGHGQVDGGQADHLRIGQSRPGNHRRRSSGSPRRRHHGHRSLRLSQPGQ